MKHFGFSLEVSFSYLSFSLSQAEVPLNSFKNRFAPNTFLNIEFLPSPVGVLHQRDVYTAINLIGDIGGVFPILVYFFSFFLTPYSHFRFILKWISKLYLVKATKEIPGVTRLKNKLGKHKFKRYKMEMPEVLANSKVAEET